MIQKPDIADAVDLLVQAGDCIHQRAALRDQPTGERSMARAVAAFNALYDKSLTETEGWQFMVILKQARAAGGAFHIDDYIDGAAYTALAGEAQARRAQIRQTLTAAQHAVEKRSRK